MPNRFFSVCSYSFASDFLNLPTSIDAVSNLLNFWLTSLCSSVLKENLDGHIKRCPFLKQLQSLSIQSFYQKGINAGEDEDDPIEEEIIKGIKVEDLALPIAGSLDHIASEMKRKTVYGMNVPEFCNLIGKIESIYESMSKDVKESYKIPEACGMWIKRQVDRYMYM